jgi:hypothetical protein
MRHTPLFPVRIRGLFYLSLSQRPCLPGCRAGFSAIYHSHDLSNAMIWYYKPYRIVSWHKAETNMSDLWPLLKDVVASTRCTSQGRIQETNRGCTLCSWERLGWQFVLVKILWYILCLILCKYMWISEIFTDKQWRRYRTRIRRGGSTVGHGRPQST